MPERSDIPSNQHPDLLSEEARAILKGLGFAITGVATLTEIQEIGPGNLAKVAKNIAFFALSDPERSVGFTLSNVFELVEKHPTENVAIALGIGLMIAASLTKGVTRQKIEDAFFRLDDRWDDMTAEMHNKWIDIKRKLTAREPGEDKWTHGPNMRRD